MKAFYSRMLHSATRGTNRMGELLKEVEPHRGANQNIREGDRPNVETRKSVAEAAGLSEFQRKTALRVANEARHISSNDGTKSEYAADHSSNGVTNASEYAATLERNGVSRQTASRYQALANVPTGQFEAALASER